MTRSVATLLLCALVTLAGCSGDDTTAGDSPAPAASGPPAGSSASPSGPSRGDGSGAGTRYCQLLGTDFATMLSSMQSPEDVERAVAVIRQVAAEAPDEVADEWGVMSQSLDRMESTLTKAADLQQQVSAGELTPKQVQRRTAKILEEMESLESPENTKAGDTVAQHANERCGLNLG